VSSQINRTPIAESAQITVMMLQTLLNPDDSTKGIANVYKRC